jgi:hypothetical protein
MDVFRGDMLMLGRDDQAVWREKWDWLWSWQECECYR